LLVAVVAGQQGKQPALDQVVGPVGLELHHHF